MQLSELSVKLKLDAKYRRISEDIQEKTQDIAQQESGQTVSHIFPDDLLDWHTEWTHETFAWTLFSCTLSSLESPPTK